MVVTNELQYQNSLALQVSPLNLQGILHSNQWVMTLKTNRMKIHVSQKKKKILELLLYKPWYVIAKLEIDLITELLNFHPNSFEHKRLHIARK